MRIIAGEFRGRRLSAPPGQETRPMLARVREALFAILSDWVPEARVLDLFAGTGSLGLEALSRGSKSVVFVEKSKSTANILEANAEMLLGEDMRTRTRVIIGDASSPVTWRVDAEGSGGKWADLVLLDPPYAWLDEPPRLRSLREGIPVLLSEVLAPDGRAVLHVPRRSFVDRWLPAEAIDDRRDYGTSSLWFLRSSPSGARAPQAAEEAEDERE